MALDCKCSHWAVGGSFLERAEHLYGNGHHPQCELFAPLVGVADLLKELVAGIEYWSAQEDGVPDELWEAYRKAVWFTRGQMLSDEGRG